jgi:zeaxanthin glucosyltransferase
MEHFAIFSAPFPSHIGVMESIASEMLDHGHRVTWIHQADVKSYLNDPRIGYREVGLVSHPAGSLDATLNRAARPGGPLGLRRVITDIAKSTAMLCSEAPAALVELGVTFIIADQMEAAGGLVAEGLHLAYVSVACALPVNRESAIPLPVMPWAYATSLQALRLNKTSTRIYDWLMRPHARVIFAYASAFKLSPRRTISDCLSPLAQVSQTTSSFDFPRATLPAYFHHVGPIRRTKKSELIFNFPVNPQRPFVFASLGTLQGGRINLFMRIAQASKAEKFQLLIAHCNHLDASAEQALRDAGATWVTGFTDQQAAVAAANVVITHGGLNTVMDALSAGTPMLVVPIAFDQPGVATRVTYAGAGLHLTPRKASTMAIAKALRRLVEDVSFGQQARRVGKTIESAGGVHEVARVVMSVASKSNASSRGAKGFVGDDVAESAVYAT